MTGVLWLTASAAVGGSAHSATADPSTVGCGNCAGGDAAKDRSAKPSLTTCFGFFIPVLLPFAGGQGDRRQLVGSSSAACGPHNCSICSAVNPGRAASSASRRLRTRLRGGLVASGDKGLAISGQPRSCLMARLTPLPRSRLVPGWPPNLREGLDGAPHTGHVFPPGKPLLAWPHTASLASDEGRPRGG